MKRRLTRYFLHKYNALRSNRRCRGCTALVICTTSILPLLDNTFRCLLPIGLVVVSFREPMYYMISRFHEKESYNINKKVQTTQNRSVNICHLLCSMPSLLMLGGLRDRHPSCSVVRLVYHRRAVYYLVLFRRRRYQ